MPPREDRVDGPTPHGGTYAIVIRDPVTDQVFEIVEYDDSDTVIARNYAEAMDPQR